MAKEEEGMLLLLRCGNLLEDWCEECVDCRVFSGIYDGSLEFLSLCLVIFRLCVGYF